MEGRRRPGTRILVMGRQGAGKGTQCARLAAELGVPHVSTGDALRAAAAAGTALGLRAKAYMEAGELVPDDVVVGIVVDRLRRRDAQGGFVLDGFPRTAAQAAALFATFGPDAIDVAIDIDVPVPEVLRRLRHRRVCIGCGAIHSAAAPGQRGWACAACGGRIERRADDHPGAIERRLELYEEQTGPMLIWFHSRGILRTVDGVGDPCEVHERVLAALNARAGATGTTAGTARPASSASRTADAAATTAGTARPAGGTGTTGGATGTPRPAAGSLSP